MKIFQKLYLILFICAPLILSNCTEDEETSSASIVGEWTTNGATVDVTINGISLMEFMNLSGLPTTEIEQMIETMNDEFSNSGTLTFRTDGIYIANWEGEETDEGTYTVNNDATVLAMTNHYDESTEFQLINLSSSQLIIEQSITIEEDIDQVGGNDTLLVTVQLSFKR